MRRRVGVWAWAAAMAGTLVFLGCARRGTVHLRRRYGRPPRREIPPACPPPDAVAVALPGVNGRTLRGWFLSAGLAERRLPTALVMHGWGASASDMIPVALRLNAAAVHVLLLDARGHGRSDDDEFTSMPRFGEDIRAGLMWLRRHPHVDVRRITLVGHSVGAGACLLVASTDRDLAAVISIASMANPKATMARMLRPQLPRPLTAVALRVVEHAIGQRFETFAPIETIGRIRTPVLILHGGRDSTVPVEDAYALQARAGPRARLHVVTQADHTSVDALPEVTSVLLRFLHDAGVINKATVTVRSARLG